MMTDKEFVASLEGSDLYYVGDGCYFRITGEPPEGSWYINGKLLVNNRHPSATFNFPEPFLSFCLAHHNLIS